MADLRRVAGGRSAYTGRRHGGAADALVVIEGANVWVEESAHRRRNAAERRGAVDA